MSKVFIEEETLIGIGNAIREKNGTTDLIATTDMATAISNLATGNGSGNWSAPVALTWADTQIKNGVKDSTTTTITFDFSNKIEAYDYDWMFLTCWAVSGSTKYTVAVMPLTTVFPDNVDTAVKLDNCGVWYMQYGKSGSATNANVNALIPYSLYIEAYYNPATCELKLRGSGMSENQFKNYVDTVGQLVHRKST